MSPKVEPKPSKAAESQKNDSPPKNHDKGSSSQAPEKDAKQGVENNTKTAPTNHQRAKSQLERTKNAAAELKHLNDAREFKVFSRPRVTKAQAHKNLGARIDPTKVVDIAAAGHTLKDVALRNVRLSGREATPQAIAYETRRLAKINQVRNTTAALHGQILGYVGATGNATGPHLHLEVRRQNDGGWDNPNANNVDPIPLFG